jgi:hypothetical protein
MQPVPSNLIRSNPITWWQLISSTNLTLFTNTRPGTVFVVTFCSLINTSSDVASSILLVDTQTGVAFHSGDVGSGTLDRFPLTCEIAFASGAGWSTADAIGAWAVAVTGHYQPATLGG